MQKKNNTRIKIILFIGIVVLLAILLVPFEFTFVSDGGSHGCRAIAYSVWYQHSFSDPPFGRDKSTGMMYTSYKQAGQLRYLESKFTAKDMWKKNILSAYLSMMLRLMQ